MKKMLLLITSILFSLTLFGCSSNEVARPTNIQIEEGIKTALKNDENINFDKMSDLSFTEAEVSESDMETLKNTYASKVDYVKYESTFSLVSVEMDMIGNYSCVFVYNNGQWSYSFGYITDIETWEYIEKDASRVDKQRMLSDLKEVEFASFEKGYIGNPKYSSLKNITNREYEEEVHRDTIEANISVETNFAEYTIPVKMIYYFNKGEWVLGDVEVSEQSEWSLEYNSGSAPEFLSDNTILSYLTTDTNFLTYVCNLNYVDSYEIIKESEIASVDTVDVTYVFSTRYDYIGTINYDVIVSYQWLNNEWSDAEPVVTFRDADLSEMTNYTWNNENGTYFKFETIEKNEDASYRLSSKYFDGTNNIENICNLNIPLRDNNWDAVITDINGNQIWDIPSSEFSLNLEYSAIVYNNSFYAPIKIETQEEIQVEETPVVNTSNEIIYNIEQTNYDNQITKDNLCLNNIAISYEENKMILSGSITNLSEGLSGYKVSVVLFDENGNILSESVLNGDSQLTANSSAIISMEINDITDDIKQDVFRITIYLTKN